MERPETRVTVLPDAGREESLELWGLTRSHRWGEAERRPRHSDELELDADAATPEELELEELGFLLDGGWSTVDTTRGRTGLSSATGGARDAGMSSHRGVLHPHEHVDAEALRPAVEAELGFTLDDVHAVYRQGRKSAAQLELRARIDARLLEVAEAGGNLTELGRALGFPVHEGSTPWAMKQAVARARQERSATS